MMAESWRRLIEGQPKPHDLTLINHEIMEKELMQKGYSQEEAHIITSKKYNYGKEAAEFYDKIKKISKGIIILSNVIFSQRTAKNMDI